jgi:signal peptidase I
MSGPRQPKSGSSNLIESLLYFATVLAIVVVLRAFVFQPFNIPSGSMKSTLLVGDHLIVSKFSYGISRYSLPFAPIPFSGRIFGSPPERGDIVVFRAKLDDEMRDVIKRVVGLPGDRVQVIAGHLHINGEPVRRERIADFVGENPCGPEGSTVIATVRRWRETLPNGVRHETLDCTDRGPLDSTPMLTVPAGRYFLMGDNRDDSFDSRVPEAEGGFGPVPFDNLLGRAQVIFFSVAEGESAWMVWRWPWSVRWSRLLTVVR